MAGLGRDAGWGERGGSRGRDRLVSACPRGFWGLGMATEQTPRRKGAALAFLLLPVAKLSWRQWAKSFSLSRNHRLAFPTPALQPGSVHGWPQLKWSSQAPKSNPMVEEPHDAAGTLCSRVWAQSDFPAFGCTLLVPSGSTVPPHPRQMPGGCSAFLHGAGFAEWKTSCT